MHVPTTLQTRGIANNHENALAATTIHRDADVGILQGVGEQEWLRFTDTLFRLTASSARGRRYAGVDLNGAYFPRAHARARRWRRELGGGVRQHPGSNNCVEGPAAGRNAESASGRTLELGRSGRTMM